MIRTVKIEGKYVSDGDMDQRNPRIFHVKYVQDNVAWKIMYRANSKPPKGPFYLNHLGGVRLDHFKRYWNTYESWKKKHTKI
jgi:hypothetical protein